MTQGFAPVPNWLIRDTDASIYAISVYAALSSRQGKGGIFPSQKTIARDARCSERQVRYALKELEELGMVERLRRTNKGGRASDGYVLYHHGKLNEGEEFASEVAAHDAGTSDEVAAHGAGGTGTQRQSAPYIEEEPLKKNPYPYSPHASDAQEDAFSTFWNIYPRRVGKKTAETAFVKAVKSGASAEEILAGARRLRDDPNLPEPKFIPHPSTWLNRGGWEDDPHPAQTRPVQSSAAEGWFELAQRYESAGEISA